MNSRQAPDPKVRTTMPGRVTTGPSIDWGITERAVVDCAAELELQIGTISRPSHLLRLFMRRVTRKLAVPSVIDVPTRSPARYRLA